MTHPYAKVQPQAIPLEQAVLGALMLDREAVLQVVDLLSPESFYLDSHQLIYKSILSLFNRSEPVDLLTVTEELRKSGDLEKVGNAYYLIELSNQVASSANIEYHSRIIQEKWMQRRLIETGSIILRDGYSDEIDVFEQIEAAEKSIYEITAGTNKKDAKSAKDISRKVLRNIEAAVKKRESGGVTGVPTGLSEIDQKTGGLQNSDLIIIAARPGMGKTGLAMSIALRAAQQDSAVGIFSLEMSETQLMARLIGGESGVSSNRMMSGDVKEYEWGQLQTTIEGFDSLKLYIDDTAAISVTALRAKARRMKMKYNISLVIVDYLQLMKSSEKGGNREQEISRISQGLKALAKELDIPVIALSQLSRAVETRGGSKRPQLSDLRESGSIEQDADIVCFIYRPEYYQILEDENGRSLKGIAEIIFAKHRNGGLGTVEVEFEEQFARFSDIKTGQFPTTAPYSPSAGITANRRENDEDIPF